MAVLAVCQQYLATFETDTCCATSFLSLATIVSAMGTLRPSHHRTNVIAKRANCHTTRMTGFASPLQWLWLGWDSFFWLVSTNHVNPSYVSKIIMNIFMLIIMIMMMMIRMIMIMIMVLIRIVATGRVCCRYWDTVRTWPVGMLPHWLSPMRTITDPVPYTSKVSNYNSNTSASSSPTPLLPLLSSSSLFDVHDFSFQFRVGVRLSSSLSLTLDDKIKRSHWLEKSQCFARISTGILIIFPID